jgi:ubiquinone/menaquinone biosynthesis C-methylase UbiE
MIKVFLIIIAILLIATIIWAALSRFCVIPCPSWLGWLVELDNPLSTINKAKNIINNADIKPGMQVLDVGCGPGRVALPAARAVGASGHVVALDIQEKMLKKVSDKARAQDITNIVYVHAGIGQKSLFGNQFDRVLLVTVLGEIPDQKSAFAEIVEVLKAGGIVSVTEIVFDPHYQKIATVRKLAQEAGLQECGFVSDWFAYTINFIKVD